MRAATIRGWRLFLSLHELQVRLSCYFGCGFYSNKYGRSVAVGVVNHNIIIRWRFVILRMKVVTIIALLLVFSVSVAQRKQSGVCSKSSVISQ